jgi:hypothetical protein
LRPTTPVSFTRVSETVPLDVIRVETEEVTLAAFQTQSKVVGFPSEYSSVRR